MLSANHLELFIVLFWVNDGSELRKIGEPGSFFEIIKGVVNTIQIRIFKSL